MVTFMKNKKGTPNYMAPELFSEFGIYSYKSDVWSLGCMIFEMATGKPPFADGNLQKLINEIINTEVEQPSYLNANLVKLLMLMLDKDPEKRIDTRELVSQDFWDKKLIGAIGTDCQFPENTAQNEYLKKRSSSKKIDITRLSQNVKRNQQLKDNENYKTNADDDVKLERNQVVDFEEKNYEEESKIIDEKLDEINTLNNLNTLNTLNTLTTLNNPNNHHITKDDHPMIEQQPTTHKRDQDNQEENLIFASETSNSHLVQNRNKDDRKPVEFINFTTTIQNKNLQIENLVINVHDTSVKPIIGNKDIEAYLEPVQNAKQLSFEAYKPEDIVQVSDTEFQNHMLNI